MRAIGRLRLRFTVRPGGCQCSWGYVMPGARDRIRVQSMVWCKGRIVLYLEFGSSSDMRAWARLRFRVTVIRG